MRYAWVALAALACAAQRPPSDVVPFSYPFTLSQCASSAEAAKVARQHNSDETARCDEVGVCHCAEGMFHDGTRCHGIRGSTWENMWKALANKWHEAPNTAEYYVGDEVLRVKVNDIPDPEF